MNGPDIQYHANGEIHVTTEGNMVDEITFLSLVEDQLDRIEAKLGTYYQQHPEYHTHGSKTTPSPIIVAKGEVGSASMRVRSHRQELEMRTERERQHGS